MSDRKLTLVKMDELEPGDDFVMLDPEIWTLLARTQYRDVVKVENMQKGIKEAALRNADCRMVVKVEHQ